MDNRIWLEARIAANEANRAEADLRKALRQVKKLTQRPVAPATPAYPEAYEDVGFRGERV